MPPIPSHLSDIHDFNLGFLTLIRKLLRDDKDAAMRQLGMSVEIAAVVLGLSDGRIASLARAPSVVCRFRVNGHQLLSALAHKGVPARQSVGSDVSSTQDSEQIFDCASRET